MKSNDHKIYLKFVEANYKALEDAFYVALDDLEQKLGDLNISMPISSLPTFEFITNWLTGDFSATYVFNRLDKLDIPDVARKQLTRKLTTLMFENAEVSEYVKLTIAKIKEEVVPLYEKYLKSLLVYFKILSFVEAKEMPLVWVEKRIKENGTSEVWKHQMPTDQLIKKFLAYDLSNTNVKLRLGMNMVSFHENYNINIKYQNVVLGPKRSIDQVAKELGISRTFFGIKLQDTLKTALEDLK